MNLTQTPPDAWANIDPSEAEARYARAKRLLNMAEDAIAAQVRIIEHDGERPAYVLALDSLERARNEHESDLAELRRHRCREHVYFALDGDRHGKHSTSIEALGHACIDLQRLFDRVSQSRMTAKPAPSLHPNLKRQTRLLAEATFPSSFGLHLTIPTQPQTDGYSLVLDALEETFDLFNTHDPAEVAARHGRYAFAAFKELIERLVMYEVRPKATWRGLDGEAREWMPNDSELTTLRYQLERVVQRPPVRKEEDGTLAGASTLTNKFEFVGESGILRGQIPRKLIEQVSSCFNKCCRIWYEETQLHDPNTDRVKRHIKLLGAERIG